LTGKKQLRKSWKRPQQGPKKLIQNFWVSCIESFKNGL